MRQSGVLMHITSLPSSYGIGTMGKEAFRFVDFLKDAGQSLWQILPLTPTGYGNSPYQSCSTFAGNPYLIDLDLLIEDGLLTREEVEAYDWGERADHVDFGLMYQNRWAVLKKAYTRFEETEDYFTFTAQNSAWLSDFALFMALKDQNGGKPWYDWEKNLKMRDPDTLWNIRKELKPQTRFYKFTQYLFYKQWAALREYAHDNGVRIIGDVPIYVPLDSSDVWGSPELFDLDENLDPVSVAGCPPDCFNEDGQLWGNPLYLWDLHAKDGYTWWVRRMAAAGERYDIIRIDHFRGFESYWAVPYGDPTAREGKWLKGPGLGFINAMRKNLPQVEMIAEDLGFLTDDVKALRDASGYPGMKVLGFAFDSREPSDYLPHTYEKNTVCYTGTHDNMTMRQWLESVPQDARDYAVEYMNLSEREGLVWGTLRTAMASTSDVCILLMQDVLNLPGSARMNFPGTQSDDNWTWRAEKDYISDALAQKLCRMTKLYDRLGKKETL